MQSLVCVEDVIAVLDASHIGLKHEYGSDDLPNGLVHCALHHRAFDAGRFAFEPDWLKIRFRPQGPDAAALKVTRPSLADLRQQPHREARSRLWQRWREGQGQTAAGSHAG